MASSCYRSWRGSCVASKGWRCLYDCRTFYREYPAILQTLSGGLQYVGLLDAVSLPALSAVEQPAGLDALPGITPTLLLTRLSFSHFLELLVLDRPLQRAFYEVQAVKNSWPVRELKRVGCSVTKKSLLTVE